ncbi:MAG: hypothetical protein N4A65_07275 [Cohaesibacter sp.]|jgi:hypothetical protein|nr:hypothetical protein [Cohaesibacter sp.]
MAKLRQAGASPAFGHHGREENGEGLAFKLPNGEQVEANILRANSIGQWTCSSKHLKPPPAKLDKHLQFQYGTKLVAT